MPHWIKKWTVWEYLPWWLANVPVYGMYAWFALRSRHLFFFSNVNPDIPLGGAVGESKYDILKLLPESVKPKTLLVPPGQDFALTEAQLRELSLEFPLIAKPDVGERGFLVQKFHGITELHRHLQRFPVAFILQEFITYPVEMSILYHHFPENSRFAITSVCIKEFLSVEGDGQSTIRQLMARSERSAFQIQRFEREQPELLDRVPPPGQRLLLEPIGNHVRGTKFLNGNALIDAELEAVFRPVCAAIEGIRYGRFDLKCPSVEALRQGDFLVMELNGVLGEPAHVYDPSHGMWRAYRDFYRHWRIIFELHRAQKRQGIQPASYREAWKIIRQYFRYKKQLEAEQVLEKP